jgi:hypothetical protein
VNEAPQPAAFTLPIYSKVAPFPLDRFLKFVSVLKVQSKDYGLVNFKLLGTQRYVLDEIVKALNDGITTFTILKARQIGMSTFFLALDMFWAFEHKGLLGVFITHKEESRDDFRAVIDVFLAEIPSNYKVRDIRHNRNLLIFKNGSKFRYLIAGTSENRKGGLGRSGAANYVHGTEVAFWGNEDDIRAFKSSTSSLYEHRLQVWETTANGFNHFWDTWEEAKVSPTKCAIFVGWWRNELYQFETKHPYFSAFCPDTTPTPMERKRIKAVREEYGFEISMQQIAWYRWKLQDEFDGDQSMMDQEYPWTEDDAFQATGSKYFEVDALSDALKVAKRLPYKAFRYKLTMRWEETRVMAVRDPRAELRIWEDASQFGYYVIGCDPAYGSSDEADRTAISVWRCFSDRIVQVAEYCSNEISTYQCAWVLAHLAGYYGTNDARVILEIQGPGTAVWQEVERIRDMTREVKDTPESSGIRNVLRHVNNYFYRRADTVSGGGLAFHWRTTEELKRQVMAKYKDGFELQRLIPRSVALLEEMRRIVNDGGHIAAEGRHKDDRVIAAALAHEAWRMWMQGKLKSMNMTAARAEQVEISGGVKPVDRLIMDFMKKAGIAVPT